MEDPTNSLQQLHSEDPTILVNDDNVEIVPSLFNYGFLINCIFFPVFLVGFLNGFIFISFVGSLVFLFNIGYFLRFSNKMIIDHKNKRVLIIPNYVWKYFIKSQQIDFKDIKEFSVGYYIRSLSYRHLIKLKLSNSQELSIITVSSKNTAGIITTALNGII